MNERRTTLILLFFTRQSPAYKKYALADMLFTRANLRLVFYTVLPQCYYMLPPKRKYTKPPTRAHPRQLINTFCSNNAQHPPPIQSNSQHTSHSALNSRVYAFTHPTAYHPFNQFCDHQPRQFFFTQSQTKNFRPPTMTCNFACARKSCQPLHIQACQANASLSAHSSAHFHKPGR